MLLFALATLALAQGAGHAQGGHPANVRVVHRASGWRLTVDGKDFFVKGAGGDGSKPMLAAAGANSFRTWGADNLGPLLDEAQRLGLKVTIGIWLGHEEQGFKYGDPDMVADQFKKAKEVVLKYKDHPALLMWGLGNEMEGYGAGDNVAIWKAVEGIAKMTKQLDPNHPTMTVIAEVGGDKVKNLNAYCPDIDVVGINSYGGAPSLAERYRKAGGVKPYILTEFGPPGVWELPKTSWGAAAEPTSTEKAAIYRNVYQKAVLDPKDLCLGSYAFTWGNKQEATATWFGMLLPDGSRLGAVDAMTEQWSGKPPQNRCPEIATLKLDGPNDVDTGSTVHATLDARDPDGDPLQVQWVLQAETSAYGNNGSAESAPPTYPEAIQQGDLTGATVKLPANPGGYRLFAYLRDGHGNAAVGNIALHAKGMETFQGGQKASLPLVVYDEGDRPGPFTPSGWMGDTKALKLDPASTDSPHSGKTCLRIDFTQSSGWGAIAWQSPEGDWGDKPGGWNVSGAHRLTIWARGAHGGETVSFGVGLIKTDKKYYDTATQNLSNVVLTDSWKRYEIPLDDLDLSRIKTGLVVTIAGGPATFYLDDVKFE